jgi:predicted TIM-barrel fold metal-dependent hydrolase
MTTMAFPPPGSCDCHVHVVGPKSRFPLPRERAYTPRDAPAGALAALLQRLRLSRAVVVQPSFYGTDNACTLDAVARIDDARGIAVLPADTGQAELDALHAQGIRGLRVNVATVGAAPAARVHELIKAAAQLCEPHGWHVQVFATADVVEAVAPLLRALPVDSVLDHFGLVSPASPDRAMNVMTGLLEGGKTWVKISGAYRIAEDPHDARIGPLARRLCDANPERVVWGSDWPHTPRLELRRPDSEEELPYQDIDTAGLLALLRRWLEDDDLLHRVLVGNPARLYGFA